MRRLTQQTLISVINAAENIRAIHIRTCRMVTGLAEQLPKSDLADGIIQLVSNAEFDIYKETLALATERARIEATKPRNDYLRRRRDASNEASQSFITDDDLDMVSGLPDPVGLIEDEPSEADPSKAD